jgi:acetyl-CoA carboxylase biotin carboxylase subunit
MKIKKLLIANRGEISLRVIRACRDLGIKSIAVYSDADKNALHTREADEAYYIGPSPPSKSYLNIEAIMTAAKDSGADAIHPGYGFLSEKESFAKSVISNGLIWIGPPAGIMASIEHKCFCRKMASDTGVPYIPGTITPIESVGQIRQCFQEFGSDLLLKLDKGGGGKGIQEISESMDDHKLEEIYQSTQSMGSFAFDSSDCYIECRMENPRHIEVQFLIDHHGNCVSLGERECSIQRRYQKIIEEAPAPCLEEGEREKISKWTLKLATAIGYTNAGTMEFLSLPNGEFYFMEINSRLQVEHGVTELVTGIDIVKNQIKIADGEELKIEQKNVTFNGHAIEARVYAENPVTFIPSPGTITKLRLPDTTLSVRIDHALEEGVTITPYYDPLLAKIMVWGNSRQEAIDRMKEVHSQFHVEGIDTTLSANQRIFDTKEFVDSNINIKFVDQFLM